jgi:hypothetical protein
MMKKTVFGALITTVMVLSTAGCGSSPAAVTAAKRTGQRGRMSPPITASSDGKSRQEGKDEEEAAGKFQSP